MGEWERGDSASVELEGLYESRGQVQEGRLDREKDRGGGRTGVDWREKGVQGRGKVQGKVLRTFEDHVQE